MPRITAGSWPSTSILTTVHHPVLRRQVGVDRGHFDLDRLTSRRRRGEHPTSFRHVPHRRAKNQGAAPAAVADQEVGGIDAPGRPERLARIVACWQRNTAGSVSSRSRKRAAAQRDSRRPARCRSRHRRRYSRTTESRAQERLKDRNDIGLDVDAEHIRHRIDRSRGRRRSVRRCATASAPARAEVQAGPIRLPRSSSIAGGRWHRPRQAFGSTSSRTAMPSSPGFGAG